MFIETVQLPNGAGALPEFGNAPAQEQETISSYKHSTPNGVVKGSARHGKLKSVQPE